MVHREYIESEEGMRSFLHMMGQAGGLKLLPRRDKKSWQDPQQCTSRYIVCTVPCGWSDTRWERVCGGEQGACADSSWTQKDRSGAWQGICTHRRCTICVGACEHHGHFQASADAKHDDEEEEEEETEEAEQEPVPDDAPVGSPLTSPSLTYQGGFCFVLCCLLVSMRVDETA